jgi:hypothetical protein
LSSSDLEVECIRCANNISWRIIGKFKIFFSISLNSNLCELYINFSWVAMAGCKFNRASFCIKFFSICILLLFFWERENNFRSQFVEIQWIRCICTFNNIYLSGISSKSILRWSFISEFIKEIHIKDRYIFFVKKNNWVRCLDSIDTTLT